MQNDSLYCEWADEKFCVLQQIIRSQDLLNNVHFHIKEKNSKKNYLLAFSLVGWRLAKDLNDLMSSLHHWLQAFPSFFHHHIVPAFHRKYLCKAYYTTFRAFMRLNEV